MHATSFVKDMQDNGPPSFSKRTKPGQSFDSFDPDALLNEPFLDDSSGHRLDFLMSRSSRSSRMDIDSDHLTPNVDAALRQAQEKRPQKREPTYQSEQALADTSAALSNAAGLGNSAALYQAAERFNLSQASDGRNYDQTAFSHLSAQETGGRIAVGRQGVMADKGGNPTFQVATNQLPNQVNTDLSGAPTLPFDTTSSGIKAAQTGKATNFDVGRLQGNLVQPNNVAPTIPISQDQISSSTNVGVSVQQLEAMEKLCESMKRSAVTRSLIKQISNRSISSQDANNEELAAGGRLSREGSRRNLARNHGPPPRQTAGGRGHSRGITVSGRGLGRQGSNKSVPDHKQCEQIEASSFSSFGLDIEKPASSSSRPRNLFQPDLTGVVGTTTLTVHREYDSDSGHERSKSNPTFLNSLHQQQQASSQPERGLQRHRSNPTLMHRLQQVEDGSTDISFDGICETDSV